MNEKVKSLLAQKSWTGEEVGKLLIYSLLNDLEHSGKEYDLLFTQAEFNKMEDSLTTKQDLSIYQFYKDIYNSIVETYNTNQIMYQQFYNGFHRYKEALSGAMKADGYLKQTTKSPLIMTKQQYQKAKQDTTEAKKTKQESFYSLIFSLLAQYIEELENGEPDKVPVDIAQEINATKIEKAEGHALYASYNKLVGNGYYSLPDGRRSNQMGQEEWLDICMGLPAIPRQYKVNGKPATAKDTLKLFYKGAEAIIQNYSEQTGQELGADEQTVTAEMESVITGVVGTANNKIHSDLYELYAEKLPIEWNEVAEAPQGLTAFDILRLLIRNPQNADEKKHLNQFKTEYEALYNAVASYIKNEVPRAGQTTQLHKCFISWGELAEHKIGNFGSFIEANNRDIIEFLSGQGLDYISQTRGTLNGIAVLTEQSPQFTIKDFEYREPVNPLLELDNIYSFQKFKQKKADLQKSRDNIFTPVVKRFYAYNALIDIIGDIYGIDGIEVAKIDMAYFLTAFEAFNEQLYNFYVTAYGDREEKARKRKAIKETFSPINATDYMPAKADITKLKRSLKNLGVSAKAQLIIKDFSSLIAVIENQEGANNG